MLNKKMVQNIAIIMFAAGIIAAMVYAFINDRDNFLSITVTSGITILIAIFISYYCVQDSQNERCRKEVFLRLLEKTQEIVDAPKMCCINSQDDVTEVTMKKRSLNNYCDMLSAHACKFGMKNEAEAIAQWKKEYCDFLGEHVDDIDYLSKSQKELKRPLELMDNKLMDIMIRLYD